MVTEKEAMIIAGKVLLEYFGREFLLENKERISLCWEKPKKGIRVFHFGLFKNDPRQGVSVERNGGIYVEEKNFPDSLLSVEVALKDGSTKIVEEK